MRARIMVGFHWRGRRRASGRWACGLAMTPAIVERIASVPNAQGDCGSAQGIGLADPAVKRLCVEEPPAHLREGGLIRDGVDRELDEARTLQKDARWLVQYQERLPRTWLPGLKVGYKPDFRLLHPELDRIIAGQGRRRPHSRNRRFKTPNDTSRPNCTSLSGR